MSKPGFKVFENTRPVLWHDPEYVLSAAMRPVLGPIGLSDGRALEVTEWAPVVNGKGFIRAKLEVEIHVPESLFKDEKMPTDPATK